MQFDVRFPIKSTIGHNPSCAGDGCEIVCSKIIYMLRANQTLDMTPTGMVFRVATTPADTEGKSSEIYARLLIYIVKKFDSLISLFKTIIKCFEEGAYFYNDQNEIKFNFELEREISKRLNPDSGFWDLAHGSSE